jgi:hypothetical protein
MFQFLFGVAFGAAGYWAWQSFGRDLMGMGGDQGESTYGGFTSSSTGSTYGGDTSSSPSTSTSASTGSGGSTGTSSPTSASGTTGYTGGSTTGASSS